MNMSALSPFPEEIVMEAFKAGEQWAVARQVSMMARHCTVGHVRQEQQQLRAVGMGVQLPLVPRAKWTSQDLKIHGRLTLAYVMPTMPGGDLWSHNRDRDGAMASPGERQV